MHPKKTDIPKISLFDVFIGKGRTIRGNPGPLGVSMATSHLTPSQNKYMIKRTLSTSQFPFLNAGTPRQSTSSVNKPKDGGGGNRNGNGSSSKTNGNGGDKADKEGDGGPGPNRMDDFTAEQDAKLLEMKAQNKSWKDIETELGKPKHVLQKRFKETKPASEDAAKKAEEGKKKAEENKKRAEEGKDEAAAAKKGKEGKEKAKKKEEEEEEKKEEEGRRGRREGGAGGEKVHALADIFSLDEEQRWIRVASKFYGLTGRRMDPGDIKDKFEKVLE
ncbi:hypothetical protein H2203_001255 [Taxawa tesnikishii (nom. ined.)]|nr:hypothetical protein H2203_001255 [Dothideales sp. JES 119]